jgi:hypothetical protein
VIQNLEKGEVMKNQRYAFQRNPPAGGSAGRCVSLLVIASCLFLTDLLKPAFAQTEVCGSTCGAWAALTSAAPAFASGSNGEYLAWKGHTSNYIWFTDGTPPDSSPSDWAAEAKVKGASWSAETNVAPALVAFGADYALAWKGQSGTSIWFSILAGSTWGLQSSIAGTDTNEAPALTSNAGVLYLAWTTPADQIEYITYSGGAWSTSPTVVPGAATTLAPAITVYNGILYFAWTTTSGEIEHISYNGSWSTMGTVMVGGTPATTDLAPTLTTGMPYVGGPFLAWTAPSGEIYLANGDAASWSGSLVNNGGILSNMTPALALAESAGSCENFYFLYLAFTDEANDAIYTNTVASWSQILPPCKQ